MERIIPGIYPEGAKHPEIKKIENLEGLKTLIAEQSAARLHPYTDPRRFGYVYITDGKNRILAQIIEPTLQGRGGQNAPEKFDVYPALVDENSLRFAPPKITEKWFGDKQFITPATLEEVKEHDFGRGVKDFTLLGIDELKAEIESLDLKKESEIFNQDSLARKYRQIALALAFHGAFDQAVLSMYTAKQLQGERFNEKYIENLFAIKVNVEARQETA